VPKRRLGVVLVVPQPIAGEIDGLRRALGDGAFGRIPPHLTLVPPVNVREDALERAIDVVRTAAAETRPISVTLGPAATFHPATPVVYLPVSGEGVATVSRVRDAVFRPPLERKLTWAFTPHVTLADEASEVRIAAAVEALAGFQVDVTFSGIEIFEEGPQRAWGPIADAPFRAPAVIGRGGIELEISESARLDPIAAAFAMDEWRRYSAGEYSNAQEEEPVALTARREGKIVGTATGTIREYDSYLSRLIVPEHERRTGVGSHLLAAFEALAVRKGRTRLTLHTLADGPARQFYEHRGWQVILTMPRWRAGRDFVQMERVF
jgi:2'-5' RNA ligase/ribosomal protein S18 acetylase RimI-like enzyme